MTTYTHQTAPTECVGARGIRFAYRRFGKACSVPLVFNMHFAGTMDHWDPAVTDGLAKDREVILFNNAGVSSSSGEVPTTVEEMASKGPNCQCGRPYLCVQERGAAAYRELIQIHRRFVRTTGCSGWWSVADAWISDSPQVAMFRLVPSASGRL
jgi:pimeloyl-ACP methyl ester carboxylesterase